MTTTVLALASLSTSTDYTSRSGRRFWEHHVTGIAVPWPLLVVLDCITATRVRGSESFIWCTQRQGKRRLSAETTSWPGLLHRQLPPASLIAGANGEELACKMVEVEMQEQGEGSESKEETHAERRGDEDK
ncbi:hypothetical protein H4582DRAFT_2132917 [Lactarius indigo]|nr:hypothetical protein H4582DRAFT_2132917 [Lactarius indigo]